MDVESYDLLKRTHKMWVEDALVGRNDYHNGRDDKRTKSIAVGSKSFVEDIKSALSRLAKGREVKSSGKGYQLREPTSPYNELFFECLLLIHKGLSWPDPSQLFTRSLRWWVFTTYYIITINKSPAENENMPTINISIPEQLHQWIENQVKTGRYSNTSDYLRELIRTDKRKLEKIDTLLLEGLNSGEPVEVGTDYWENKKALLRAESE